MNILDNRPSDLHGGQPSQKRVLRADGKDSQREWRKRHMFPEECIICHSNKYKRNNITGKRSIVRLVKCELICGGQLLEAAKQKEDIALLQQIQGEDLVARELQYHRDCHRAYTRFLSKPCKPLTPIQSGYMNAFIVFSEETVKKRLIQNKEILTLSRLNRIFIHAIKEVENVDAPYRTWNLKTRLQRTFPQLVFVTPANRSMSDIVFSEGLRAEDLAQELVDDTDTTSAESSTDDAEPIERGSNGSQPNSLQMLFNAALTLKLSIDNKNLTVP